MHVKIMQNSIILVGVGSKNEIYYLFYLFMRDREREREAQTQAGGEAGSMHREPDVGFDPESSGSRPGPKAGAKPLRHQGIPIHIISNKL